MVKSWSSAHGAFVTSSGESEVDELVGRAAEALALQVVLEDLGRKLKPKLHVASCCVAKAVSGRVGLGKTKHIEVLSHEAEEFDRHQVVVGPSDCRFDG